MRESETRETLLSKADAIRARYAESHDEVEKRLLKAKYQQIDCELELLTRAGGETVMPPVEYIAPARTQVLVERPHPTVLLAEPEEFLVVKRSRKRDDTALFVGLSGAALLLLGTVAPFIQIPLAGTMSYFALSQGEGFIILLLALVSFILCFTRNTRWLYLPAAISACMMFFTYYRIRETAAELERGVSQSVAITPIKSLLNIDIGSIRLEWGLAIMFIGVLLLSGASMMSLNRDRHDSGNVSRLKRSFF